ncbi:hypothetical protein CF125_18405 [Aeromonas veronii]|nr:hypothetical protein CF125_18405 [Aeromonas veronii]
MIIPFYNICLAFIQLKMIKISDILGFTLTLLGIIVATILPVYFFGDYIHEFFSKNSIIIMPIILLTLAFIFCNNLYGRLCDKIKINKMSISKEIDRTILLSYLDRLKTNWGKYKLVSLLENERTRLTGKWRDDSFPKKLHDDAASLLAKIEEKSMGFD